MQVAITTPQRALVTLSYDIRDIMAKPKVWGGTAAKADVRARDTQFLQALLTAVDGEGAPPPTVVGESTRMLNGSLLEIRTNAARHAQVADVLVAFRRLGGIAVVVKAELREVDAACFKKVKSAKWLSLEELEQRFLQGNPPDEDLFRLVEKQTLVLAGEDIRADDRQGDVGLLSRHQVVRCLASPAQLQKGEKSRQVVLEGVSFGAGIRVSPDRRSVRLKFTEKSAEIEEIRKTKALNGKGEEVDAETPLLKETTQSRDLEIPDGGSLLLPVHYQPTLAVAKDHGWVLKVSVRIVIEEEERQEIIDALRGALPRWLLD
jgi:hypothetical protein